MAYGIDHVTRIWDDLLGYRLRDWWHSCRTGGFNGHYTLADGTHRSMTSAEAKALWRQTERRIASRAKRLPTEQAAINAMFDAFDRLKELGWSEAIYCPKDGATFEVIEPGSTGIFPCHYDGAWPDGSWWIEQDGGSPSHPILFRLYPEDEAKRKAKMEAARARYDAETKCQHDPCACQDAGMHDVVGCDFVGHCPHDGQGLESK